MIHGILLDLAGVLYQGDRRLPGASEALARLRENDLPVRFVTNTTRKTKARLLAQLHDLDLAVEDDELFTAAEATKRVLRDRGLTPHLLIHPDLEPDFADLPPGRPNAVVVADAGPAFTYDNLNRAFRLIQDGAPLLAVAKNRYFSENEGLSLDAGPFVAALEYAAQVEAEVIGKPAYAFFAGAVASMAGEAGCHGDGGRRRGIGRQRRAGRGPAGPVGAHGKIPFRRPERGPPGRRNGSRYRRRGGLDPGPPGRRLTAIHTVHRRGVDV